MVFSCSLSCYLWPCLCCSVLLDGSVEAFLRRRWRSLHGILYPKTQHPFEKEEEEKKRKRKKEETRIKKKVFFYLGEDRESEKEGNENEKREIVRGRDGWKMEWKKMKE